MRYDKMHYDEEPLENARVITGLHRTGLRRGHRIRDFTLRRKPLVTIMDQCKNFNNFRMGTV